MTTLKGIETDLIKLRQEFELEAEEHKEYISSTETKRQELLRQKNIILNNYDIQKVERAEEFIYTSGIRKNFGEGSTKGCLNDAITDVATEFEKLRKSFFGCKNYSGWSCQRCDRSYGCGPRHGYIVFEIGLKEEFRQSYITNERTEDILYYLNNLKDEKFRNIVDQDIKTG